ncbi:Winged helix-turn-helix DNA-binding domain [Plasmopara halstedii]|uniref:Winged helix-turn-helix DNA-binding domain n=1 Tax=Plasmopara halstedii TaxID=4781 RepID=A0A0P1A9G5_PLAHL|nr:Winged helix-turn-helix DNA-binding domain [Plasmopara halstedii]CEG37370.1 Winged helix-turn-helix DNA-binding domain [Plasmopara halstedii]|eukprot:XP_024573739.1 Winged helix-turn-helix DNA-binding domain [Plasmopara halstedii]
MTTTNISHRILSPVNYGEARKPPVVSPSKRIRKSRIVFDFSTEEMAKYFHMSQREAAQQLGVATVTIKRNCRRLGIVWPYRLMKSKKHAINSSAISCEDAQRIRQERALTRAKAGRSVPRKNCKRFSDSLDEDDAKIMTVDSHKSQGRIKLTDAGRAFARLPLDCEGTFL